MWWEWKWFCKLNRLYRQIPQNVYSLIDSSFLNDKMKRNYKRVLEERTMRFIRKSE